ncbi:hypothetical protein CDAR_390091 [Caerostris darwini]|uniref:Uncharacterized protein n=1 Tax=Caerostris darwini TaxID=1538125 RepID=A0AAV4WNS6_9ARAC|nr:hypothetical protein CDAR_390091 [Caerostris darwini]
MDVETSDPTQLNHCNMSDDFHPWAPLTLLLEQIPFPLSGRENTTVCRGDNSDSLKGSSLSAFIWQCENIVFVSTFDASLQSSSSSMDRSGFRLRFVVKATVFGRGWR